MARPKWVLSLPKEEIEANRHRFPNLKNYEIEARLICENSYPSQYRRYKSYARSMHWFLLSHNKKKSVGKCERCGTTEKLQSHHLRYKNLYDVKMEDLMVLCQRCHIKKFH